MTFTRTLALRITSWVLLSTALHAAQPVSSMTMLREFIPSSAEPKWIAQNDGVMGGISSGGAVITDETLHFNGKLSLENNGGFAQIYSITELSDFSTFTAAKLRVKGDGRTYQFRLATDARFRGSRIAYRAEFKTEADHWIEVSIPFDSMIPSHHGRILSGPPLNLEAVQSIAFLLGDGTPGRFSLEVDWIGLE